MICAVCGDALVQGVIDACTGDVVPIGLDNSPQQCQWWHAEGFDPRSKPVFHWAVPLEPVQ